MSRPRILVAHSTLPDIVGDGKTGMLTEPGNAAELARSMRWARENPTRMQAMGRAARADHQRRFSAQENYRQLLAVYNDAIGATPL
jgi:glycosyltransferase involved in cell wall biosynthesis